MPNGLDVSARRTISRAAARQALDIPADAVVVFAASVNNRETRKGDAHLLEALQLIHQDQSRPSAGLDPRTLILTAGEGARDGAIGGFTARTLGALTADDPRLSQAYRAADVFVLPSLEDNLPNTLLEAMAAELPVVAYRTGGIPDLLEDGVNGRVVRRGDVKQLANALGTLLTDETLRLRLGAAAGATALAKVDWSIQAATYIRMYEEELARGHRDRHASSRRRLKTFTQDPLADVARVKALLTERASSRLFTRVLREEVEELQQVIAARGGEIRDLKAVAALREQDAREMQDVIASRGGEIRDLQKALGDAHRAGARRTDLLRHLMGAHPHGRSDGDRLAVGIFGAGESGRRVLEAAVLLDCNIAWLADNNSDLQGSTDLGIAVLHPEAIPSISFDAAIIASAHRDAIARQLVQLGVDPERIVAPDVTSTDAELFDELRKKLDAGRPVGRSSGGPSAFA